MNPLPSLELLSTPAVLQGLDLPWVDQIGAVVIVLFLLLGVWRGLWWQVIRLIGVVLAVALARTFTPRLAPGLQERFGEMSEGMSYGLVWLGIFLAGLVVGSLFGMIGKKALETMQLGLVDRAGGALAGALTGAILHTAFLVVMWNVAEHGWTERTLEGTRSAYLLDTLSRKANLVMDAQAAERYLPPPLETGDPEPLPESPR